MTTRRSGGGARRALLPCAVALLLWGSAQHAAAQDSWWGADKALHFSVSVGLTGGGYALAVPLVEAPWARATLGASFSLTLGVAKELYDSTGAGDASWRDLTWDVVGTATGALFSLGVEWLIGALSEPPAVKLAPSNTSDDHTPPL